MLEVGEREALAATRSRPILEACAAGATAFSFELVFHLASDERVDPGYLGFCLAATLLVSVLVGLGAMPLRTWATIAVPSLWTAVAGWLVIGPWVGLGMGALAAALVRGIHRGAFGAVSRGILTGGSFALAIILAPRFLRRIELGFLPEPLRSPVLVVLAFGLAFAFLSLGVQRGLARFGRSLAVPALLLLFAGLASKPYWSGTRREPISQSGPRQPAVDEDSRPSIFVLLLDTVRADHLSVYGYERETTPELARLLEERPGAARFPFAFANGTWTVPSHATLFTGELPSQHGAQFQRAAQVGFSITSSSTLAERLSAAGYTTAAVYANFWLSRVEGLKRGFDHYVRTQPGAALPLVGEALRERLLPGLFADQLVGEPSGAYINQDLIEILDAVAGRPLYAFLNYTDPHHPYLPPPSDRGTFSKWSPRERANKLGVDQNASERARLEARYDEEIRALDRYLGELFAELEDRGRLANSWIFITSDHGEAFAEHQVTEHGTTVYNEVSHVPLLVFPPSGSEVPVSGDPVSLVDISATIAAIAGAPPHGVGRDLRQAPDRQTEARIEFYGDATKAERHGDLAREPARALVRGRYKLIEHAGRKELYDLNTDPGEQNDLAAREPALVDELSALLPEWNAEVASEVDWSQSMSEDALEQLRQSGYLGGDD